MKNILVTFFVCAIVTYLVMVVGVNLIFNSIWGIILFVSLVLTILVCLFEEQFKLYLNGEMDLEDWVAMMQDLGAAEISLAN